MTGGSGRAVRIAVTVEVGDEDEPPKQPSAPEVEGASTSSVRVSWTPPGNTGPEIDDYDVEYRRDGTDEFTDAEHEGTATETEIGSLLEGATTSSACARRMPKGSASGPNPVAVA